MAITPVQASQATAINSASVTAKFPGAVTLSDLLLAGVSIVGSASVASIVDPGNRRWIQVGQSYNGTYGTEIWACRGATSNNASVGVSLTGSATSVSLVAFEASGVAIVPVDQWVQNFGTSASAVSGTCTPRQTGDLFFTVCAAGASVGSVSGGYTFIPYPSANKAFSGVAYNVESGSVSSTPAWTLASSTTWATTTACFLAGSPQNPSGVENPLLQFPEVWVQVAPVANWSAPLSGLGTWTDVTQYVQSMDLGPIGRQHELDRVQAAPGQFVFDNRTGQFNPWNTQSFLYGSGNGLDPMTPIRVVAAWNNVTYPIYYGYFQSLSNVIKDVLDVDAQLDTIDIFNILSLKYLTNNNYSALIKADGGANLVAYYRLGDALGNFTVGDTSGNGYTGSLISGVGGVPAYNATGAFLFDVNTAVDLTNGTNAPNGGIQMVDNTSNPPAVYNPLAYTTNWTFECWAQWTQSSAPAGSVAAAGSAASVAAVPNGVLFHASSASVHNGQGALTMELQAGYSGATGEYTPAMIVMLTNGTTASVAAAGIINESNIFDGNYHHIVYNGGIYVDGNVLPTNYLTYNSVAASITGLTVGATPQTTSPIQPAGQTAAAWAGVIDEVAIYDVALTAAQISNHYAQGTWFRSVEVGAATGGTTTNRLAKVLSICDIPTSVLNVPYPFRTYLYAETNPVTTTSGLNYVQTMTETEPGIIFQGPNGAINAYNRQYQYLNSTSTTSQGIFGDNTSTASYYYEGTSFTLGQDDLDLFNDIQVQSGRGGFELSATNALAGSSQDATGAPFTVGGGQLEEWGSNQSSALATSASVYGARTLQGLTSLQEEYDSDALAMAQLYAAWYSSPISRIDTMVINSYANSGNNIPQMLGRGVFDQVTVQYQGQVPGPQFSQSSVIEGITHSISMEDGPTWKTTFNLSPFELLLSPIYLGEFVFGSSDSVLVF